MDQEVTAPRFTAANASQSDDLMDFSDLFSHYYEYDADEVVNSLVKEEDNGHQGQGQPVPSPNPLRGVITVGAAIPGNQNILQRNFNDTSQSAASAAAAQQGTKRNLTEEQRLERRERNREHAKRSRIRKRFMLESLQEQFMGLQRENMALRQIIKDKIPARADSIFEKCTDKISDLISTPVKDYQALRFLIEPDFRLVESLTTSQQNFTVSDPSLPDNPIVYASQGFLDLTGYRMDQILGRNCRFLQGPGTDRKAVEIIRKGVQEGRDMSVCLLNYKADGTPFWNQFFVAPLRDANDQIVNFVGVQCEVREMSSDRLRDTLKKMPLPEET
ncbi:unnamed protein product [Heterosigma akashiwo]|uniref:Aureochrome3 n=1 Tax=Heterosigma akashiwo TaxID=2829 RepID=A0A1L4A1R1_HETAK|nr:aureochrome3 [Heterosigma akashiwo]|mmetsp:Transcript_4529/g.6647  ORF Transcript_4529/g.6647 Transcript_4529/m.6647 type:complete len:331 (+) Transcript_4529:28-1020(+)